jgi:dTDP-4-amino-4,6-dideoxygalactose transaminase
MKRIPFNRPYNDNSISESLRECLEIGRFSGDGKFTKDCSVLMENLYSSHKVLLTTSCTHALEMSAILAEIKEDDEVIMPSYTFVSTANAFVLRGAKIVFVDIRPDTMNIDEKLIEAAVTPKTKAIVPVHYAGVACEMDVICEIAKKYNLLVIEDAAQGVNAKYKNKFLGSIGQLGCFSFHETKNFHCGEGGALLINDKKFAERAEIIREKGTDRSRFFRGQVDKYTWQDLGSSYLLSELNAAFLYPQLKEAVKINKNRILSWDRYYAGLETLQKSGIIDLPVVPLECEHNAHMFYFKVASNHERGRLIEFLNSKNINSIFHYVPLHTSPAGLKYGRFHGTDKYTSKESERLIRLPLYFGLSGSDIDRVTDSIRGFYNK